MSNSHTTLAFDPEQLGQWLDRVQRYPVTAETAERLAEVLTSVSATVQKIDGADTLFWTEPENMATLLASDQSASDD